VTPTRDETYLGTDLRVMLGPPGLSAHDAASLDLRSTPKPSQRAVRRTRGLRATPVGEPDHGRQGWQPEPPNTTEILDLDAVTGRTNLAQALALRLLTPKGALASLGHANYGSRLGELVGQRKTEELRGLCRAYILEAVREEPRVEAKPLAITFDPQREAPWDFVVEIAVQPVAGGDPVSLGLEVAL